MMRRVLLGLWDLLLTVVGRRATLRSEVRLAKRRVEELARRIDAAAEALAAADQADQAERERRLADFARYQRAARLAAGLTELAAELRPAARPDPDPEPEPTEGT